jgi:hypothetical protein
MDWFQQELNIERLESFKRCSKDKRAFKIRTLVRRTLNKCISTHSCRTRAHWSVIYHIANSVLSTCSRTRINAFISDTRLVSRAIIAYDTFRSTTRVRIALILRQTSTYSVRTLSIRATRRRIAWIITWRFFCYTRKSECLDCRKKTESLENSYVEEVYGNSL